MLFSGYFVVIRGCCAKGTHFIGLFGIWSANFYYFLKPFHVSVHNQRFGEFSFVYQLERIVVTGDVEGDVGVTS